MKYRVEIRTQQVVEYVVEAEVEASDEEAAIEEGWRILLSDQDRHGVAGNFENTYERASAA